ncbi:MAG TPA: tetratricopeptide repeat protein [Ohtaekwangia sp.]|uniref:tetratricopeptide repeat-containing sensor histidine kinase n=1 Tax=Ohtaekwangia sp. TaxID=2066019 RepID=UPI002F95DC95
MNFKRWPILLVLLPVISLAQARKDSLNQQLRQAIVKNDPAATAKTLSLLAFQYYQDGQNDSALLYYYKSLSQKNIEKNKELLASNFNGIGVIYSLRGLMDSSIYYYTKSLGLYHELKDTTNAIILDTNLSIIFKNKGIYEKSLEHAFGALAKMKEEPSRTLASCYNTIGLVYLKTSDYKDALLYARKALNVRKSLGIASLVGQSLNSIGEIYIAMHLYDSALQNLQEALVIKRASDERKTLTSTLNNIGDALYEQRKFAAAKEYYEESLIIKREFKDILGEAVTLNNLAKVSIALADLKHAEQFLNDAHALITRSGALNELRRNLEIRIQLLEKKKDFAQAFRYTRELLVVRDSLMTQQKSESLMSMQFRYDVEKKEQQIVLLEQRHAISQTELKTKQILIEGLIIALFLFIVIVVLVYYNFRVVRSSKRHIETLLKELHHRVKNNLQILASVLSLQSQQLQDENALQAVKSSESRVNAMALIHKKLYLGDQNRNINIKDYITELVQYLSHTYGFADRNFNLNLKLEEVHVDVDKAIPLGLIINELVSNSFKYAYTQQPLPALNVSLYLNKQKSLSLEISDNGSGFEDSAGKKTTGAFGLKMVKTLLKELKGKLDMNTDKGTSFTLDIPLS